MPRNESSGLVWPPRQLACIVCAMLVAGCASPRTELLNRGAASGPTTTAISASEQSPVRLAAAEQSPNSPSEALPAPASTDRTSPSPSAAEMLDEPAGQPLALPDAIALAFQRQPRLRVYLEGIQQAVGRNDIAFAPYLPTLSTGYSVGGYGLNVGGTPVPIGPSPGFTVLPPGFALPVGLDINTGYELAELRLQWLICDFGRRLGGFNASMLRIDLHHLQTERAYQTAANEVQVG